MLTSTTGASVPEELFQISGLLVHGSSLDPEESRPEKDGSGGGLVVPLKPRRQTRPDAPPAVPIDPDDDDDPPPPAAA